MGLTGIILKPTYSIYEPSTYNNIIAIILGIKAKKKIRGMI